MTSQLSDVQLLALKQQLLQRQGELIYQIQDRFGLNYSQTDSIGELSSYDNHPADAGTELFERGKDLVLLDVAERELEAINKALHAIAEGTYGICRICSMDIPLERLQALPTADTCLQHAENSQITMNKRPVEEEIIMSNRKMDDDGNEANRHYDVDEAWLELSRYGSSDSAADLFDQMNEYTDEEHIGFVEEIEKYSNQVDD